jgi:hypothetical protein
MEKMQLPTQKSKQTAANRSNAIFPFLAKPVLVNIVVASTESSRLFLL